MAIDTSGIGAVTFRPIASWPGVGTPAGARRRSPFKATWAAIQADLSEELRHLKARSAVLQMDLDESKIRLDGYPYASAVPSSPRVILNVELRNGESYQYPCDTYLYWQDNIRAIGLTLRALRAIERYGVTRHGEQYAGWKQIPAVSGQAKLTPEQAAAVVVDAAELPASAAVRAEAVTEVARSRDAYLDWYNAARKRAHPNAASGSPEQWDRLELAKVALDAHHGVDR